jgi:protein-L-isoaspartate(D-aspartate) O-methyltransferase
LGLGKLTDSYGGYRARLVETLAGQGITDMSVLAAFGAVPRHLFVPEVFVNRAYDDTSLPIGNGQTISQPSTHARYLQALGLKGREKVLEIGTGSGYQTALLSFLADVVISVERIDKLAQTAKAALSAGGFGNVSVVLGDGTLGWRPLAPYDAILVGAAGPTVPEPLKEQLKEGGHLVIPVDAGQTQQLKRFVKRGAECVEEDLGEARFVPLVGRHGHEGPPIVS